jgi:Zn-dependent protease
LGSLSGASNGNRVFWKLLGVPVFDHISIPTILVSYVALLFSLSVHEASHATAAYWLEDDTAARLGRMTLNPIAHMDPIGTFLFPLLGMTTGLPFIGWAKPVPIQPNRFTRKFTMRTGIALVSGAGPASNLILSMIFLLITTLTLRIIIPSPELRVEMFFRGLQGPESLMAMNGGRSWMILALGCQIILINILLAIFNMLPVGPLDGAGVLQGLLPVRWAQVFEKYRPHMYIVLLILVFTGMLRFVLLPIILGVYAVLQPVALFLLGV